MLDWVKQVCVLYLHVYVQKVVGTLRVLHKKNRSLCTPQKKCSGYSTQKNALGTSQKKTLSGYSTQKKRSLGTSQKKKHWVLHKKNLQPDITDILFKEVHTPII